MFGFNAVSFVFVLGTLALLPGSRAAVSTAGQIAAGLGSSMKEGLRYVFGQRSIASLMLLLLLAGVFGTPPVAFMVPGIVGLILWKMPIIELLTLSAYIVVVPAAFLAGLGLISVSTINVLWEMVSSGSAEFRSRVEARVQQLKEEAAAAAA